MLWKLYIAWRKQVSWACFWCLVQAVLQSIKSFGSIWFNQCSSCAVFRFYKNRHFVCQVSAEWGRIKQTMCLMPIMVASGTEVGIKPSLSSCWMPLIRWLASALQWAHWKVFLTIAEWKLLYLFAAVELQIIEILRLIDNFFSQFCSSRLLKFQFFLRRSTLFCLYFSSTEFNSSIVCYTFDTQKTLYGIIIHTVSCIVQLKIMDVFSLSFVGLWPK